MRYHYTYWIINIKENKYYIGVRSPYCHPKEDIGIKYFGTKIKNGKPDIEFVNHQKDFPEEYEYRISGIFPTRKEANEDEIFQHKLYHVGRNSSFYNGTEAPSSKFSRCGVKPSEEDIRKSTEGVRRYYATNPDARRKNSEAQKKSYKENPERRKKLSIIQIDAVCVTNGLVNKRLLKEEQIPDGFYIGTTQRNKKKAYPQEQKEIVGDKIRKRQINCIWVTNEIINMNLPPGSEVPEGFRRGKKKRAPNKNPNVQIGGFWVNNGIESKHLKKGSEIPEGFVLGMIKGRKNKPLKQPRKPHKRGPYKNSKKSSLL